MKQFTYDVSLIQQFNYIIFDNNIIMVHRVLPHGIRVFNINDVLKQQLHDKNITFIGRSDLNTKGFWLVQGCTSEELIKKYPELVL